MGGEHYLPLTPDDREKMLEAIGAASVEELFSDIPQKLRLDKLLQLPPPLSEPEAYKHISSLAGKNISLNDMPSFLGGGVYDHFVPAIIKHITGRSEFYTSYTPYQPEISQGVLQAIFEYQTMLCMLTGMDVANASMYDGGTAVAEAAIMGCGATRRSKVLVSRSVSPFYRHVMESYFRSRGLPLEEIPLRDGQTDLAAMEKAIDSDVAAVVLQQPNFFGLVEELTGVSDLVHEHKAVLVAAVDPLSLPLLKAPVEYGVDIAVGEGQGLGVPPTFGGPLLGFIAAREKFIRQMPGRIAGETVDVEGNRAYVLTLQTREQHIRREKAASNICSNEALVALAASVYMAALGPAGMREVAELCLQKSAYAREKITAIKGYDLLFDGSYFKEFPLSVPGDPAKINEELIRHGIIGGLDLSSYYPELDPAMLVAVTENRSREEIDRFVSELEGWK